MASVVAIKVASGVGILGVIGGGAVLSKPYLFPNKPTLKSEIEKDGWTVLSSSHISSITEILDVYKKQSSSPFTNFTGNESNASNKLLEECKQLYENPIDKTSKGRYLKKLKRWCVVPKTAKERLIYLGIKLFSVDAPANSGNENQNWVEKVKKHTSDAKNKFSDLTTIESGGGHENSNAKKLRDHCNTKLGTKSTEESFDDTLNKIKLWCSNHQD